ncbi:hypothetical protein SU69_05105 [Thermosipho melanesiensis]|uniref:GAF domain-containing protein n=2 Tax=Thermosipho melanesiensis TaxID=46541 RepID=A6LLQ7_THEM4|nr:hypothetical protein [Thermosipho melanesiensis]ABR30858.1 hypothetical protein Tmel_0997 [Thermosipho melanesiensis BI429]APT73977.1 hypothetical protein BW47_05340 [Thermosipho melanesiensis]OOC35911.1 hypothetical protein SU68_05160 [Thermosipho melanesiensis]OOC38413.1 hypothetical protein SU69_05105 [Thermosipho melanesiensis]OOC38874.1 hypothetical protein SU70_05105 [Thermosipho melanesiensis]
MQKYFNYIEIIVLNTIIFFIDILFKYYGYVLSYPNPYFVLNIYISIRHGINLFFFSTSLSLFYYFTSLYIHYKINIFSVIFSWSVMRIPLIILSIGFLIGFFRDMYIQKINEQANQIKILNEKIKRLKENIKKYSSLTKDLQNKLLLENKGVSLFVDKLKEIEFNNPEDIFNEAVELISDFVNAITVSIYTISKNNFLRLKVRKGSQILPNSFPIEKSKIISTANELGFSSASVLYLSDENVDFSMEPVMAAKISQKNKTVGFVVIENIDPEKINKNTETYLKLLSDWLSNLLYVSLELEKQTITTDVEKFNLIFEKIDERFRRFKIPYSFIKISVSKEFEVNEIKKYIRETDFVFFNKEKNELNIILTSCNSKGLERVLEKIRLEKNIKVLEAYTKE